MYLQLSAELQKIGIPHVRESLLQPEELKQPHCQEMSQLSETMRNVRSEQSHFEEFGSKIDSILLNEDVMENSGITLVDVETLTVNVDNGTTCSNCAVLNAKLCTLNNDFDELRVKNQEHEALTIKSKHDISKMESSNFENGAGHLPEEISDAHTSELLRVKISELESKLNEIAGNIASTEEKIVVQELSERIEKLNSEKENILLQHSITLASEIQNFLNLQASFDMKTDEVATLQVRIKQLVDLQTNNGALQMQLTEENAALIKNIKKLTEEKVKMQERINEELSKSTTLEGLTAEIPKLKEENEKLCLEIEELESLNLDHISLREEMEDLTESIRNLRAQKEELLAVDVTDKNATGPEQLAELQKMSEELDIVRSKNKKFVDGSSLFNPSNSSSSTVSANAITLQEINALETKNQELAKELKRKSSLFDTNTKDYLAEINALKFANKQLIMELEEVKAFNCCESYECVIKELNEEIFSLKEERDELKRVHCNDSGILPVVVETNKSDQDSELSNASNKVVVETLQQEILELNKQITGLEETKCELELNLEAKNMKIVSLLDDVERIKIENVELDTKVPAPNNSELLDASAHNTATHLESRVRELEVERDSSLEYLRELNHQKQDLLSEIEQLRSRSRRLADEFGDPLTPMTRCSPTRRRRSSASIRDEVSYYSYYFFAKY